MKRKIVNIFVVIVIITFLSPAAEAGLQIQYLSPLPGSSHVSPEARIIFRPGALINGNTLDASTSIVAEGDLSGQHSGTIVLADDGRTVVFTPSIPFRDGEHVTVRMADAMRTVDDKSIHQMSYQFTVSNSWNAQQHSYSPLEEFDNATPARSQNPAFVSPSRAGILGKGLSGGPILPANFPPISITMSGETAPGYVFLSNFGWGSSVVTTQYLMIVDNVGNPVFYKEMSGNCYDLKLQPNGHLTYFDGALNMHVEMDSNYNTVNTYTCAEGYANDVHDLRLLPNGHALLLGRDDETIDMSVIVPGGNPAATVLGLIIQELDKDKNVVFEWRSWDHFKITDATHIDFTAHNIDCVHANAIDVDTDGNILLSSRHLDEITKIDRSTGEIIWRMGGKNNQFTFLNDTLGFSHQHAIRHIGNGNITLFDNGNYHVSPSSRAVEYHLDEENRVATQVWEYRNTPPIFGSAMGYVERLPNGNTLIGWGATNPTVTEVTSDGKKIFELTLPENVISYRAYRYPWDVGSSVEDVRDDRVGTLLPGTIVLNENYPNPFNPSTKISFMLGSTGDATLKVFNLLGQEVATLASGAFPAGQVQTVNFDASQLPSGVYCYQLQSGRKTEVKKMLLLK